MNENYNLKKISRMLYDWQRHRGLDDEFIGDIIGCSGRTWSRRKREPENLTVNEYWRIVKALRIPAQEASDAILSGITE